MGQIIEGRWDCSSCGKKLIPGRYKHCPGCGRGRGEDVQFYVADPNDVADAEQVEQGPDWLCSYCGAYAPFSAACCPNCGAEKSGTTYFDVQQQREEEESAQGAEDAAERAPQRRRISPLVIVLIVLAAIGLLVYTGSPRTHTAAVSSKAWTRQVYTEALQWVDEKAWDLPAGAQLTGSSREIRSYDRVLDHYEERSRQVPEQYVSGYRTEYQDLGNGYFQTVEVPVYSTRYRTEYYREPVYRNEPVYGILYSYRIQRWVQDRTLTASGGADEPVWPEWTPEDSSQRESGREEAYTLSFRGEKDSYTARVPLALWQEYGVGDRVTLKIGAGGQVLEISPGK